MRQISKVLARRVIAVAIVASFAVPFAGAATRETREPGFEGPRPRLVRIVKKIVKSLGDLLSQPRP
jgi:hypothetical protein